VITASDDGERSLRSDEEEVAGVITASDDAERSLRSDEEEWRA